MTAMPLILTPGEPAGIGPDLVIQLAQQKFSFDWVVVADPDLLEQRAKLLNLPLKINFYQDNKLINKKSVINLIPSFTAKPVKASILNPQNSAYVINCLKEAVHGCLAKKFSALVTGPVHKGVINQAGIKFSGHTEFLEKICKAKKTIMMFQTKNNIRLALVTTHLPLREVPKAITNKLLTETLELLNQELKTKFRIKNPKILVTGLNPHAGENGFLGREEIEIIKPVLKKLKAKKINLIGPIAADTAFIAKNLNQADIIVAMYHDQGLTALKALGFDEAVNITLGLPFIRTSVDHGTALELAGTGKANPKSLLAAMRLAEKLT